MGGLKQAQNALWAFARTIRELPEEDFRRLIKTAAPLEAAALPVKRKLTAFDRPVSLERDECERILHRLMSATTREIGADIVSESFPQKNSLFAFAQFLNLPVQKKDKTERIRERIVSATVGAKLASQAIRGKPDQVALD